MVPQPGLDGGHGGAVMLSKGHSMPMQCGAGALHTACTDDKQRYRHTVSRDLLSVAHVENKFVDRQASARENVFVCSVSSEQSG